MPWEEYVTFDGMVKVCAEAAGVSDPKIVHYDPKSIEAKKVAEALAGLGVS